MLTRLDFSAKALLDRFWTPTSEKIAFLLESRLDPTLSAHAIQRAYLAAAGELSNEFDTARFREDYHEQRRRTLRTIQTYAVCLVCLARRPEHTLTCGHGLCDTCLKRHFSRSGNGYTFHVHHCLVCGVTQNRKTYLKPPTAAPSLLAIDGGGVRGIIALQMLDQLQAELDVPYQIWEFFDLVVGTSAGKLALLSITRYTERSRWPDCARPVA